MDLDFLATLIFMFGLGHFVKADYEHLKCCSPEVWEAKIVNPGTTHRQQNWYNKMDVSFAYDLPNDQWAVDQIHPEDDSQNLKLVFKYNEGKKYAINRNGCFVEELDARLNPYCIGRNASYLGEMTVGMPDHPHTYRVWSYDLFMFPLRHTIVVSKENCLPIKEIDYALIQNTWAWSEGEPPCIPWEEPQKVTSGECYKSHEKVKREFHGTQPTASTFNVDYVDVNLAITNEEIFNVPTDCKNDTWADNVRLNDFWRILIMRMKYYDEEKDAPGQVKN